MLLHEVLEKAVASFLIFRDVPLERRYRHSVHVAYCEDSGNLNAQGEPFDVAVKFPREKESGLQCRVREIMLFDRNENSLEAHGDLQFVRMPHTRTVGATPETSRPFTHHHSERDRYPSLSSISRASSIVSSPII
jgi:hypothetical protein